MATSNSVNSNSHNAGHLLAIWAWLLLFVVGTIILSVVVVNVMGDEPEKATSLFWPIISAILFLSVVVLITARGLKKHKQWARYVGIFLAVMALIAFPVGTVMGLFILSYINKGWHES